MLKNLNQFRDIVPEKYQLETKLVYQGQVEQRVDQNEILNWQHVIT